MWHVCCSAVALLWLLWHCFVAVVFVVEYCGFLHRFTLLYRPHFFFFFLVGLCRPRRLVASLSLHFPRYFAGITSHGDKDATSVYVHVCVSLCSPTLFRTCLLLFSLSRIAIVVQFLSYSFRHSCCLTGDIRPPPHTHRWLRVSPATFLLYPHPPAVLGSSGSVALLASHSIAQSSSSSRDVIRRRFCSWLASTSTIPFAVASLCTPLSISFAFLLSIVPHGPSFSLDVPFPFYFLLFTTSRVKPFAPLLRMAYDRRTKSPRS